MFVSSRGTGADAEEDLEAACSYFPQCRAFRLSTGSKHLKGERVEGFFCVQHMFYNL